MLRISSGVMVWACVAKKQTATVARITFIRMVQSFLHTDKPEHWDVMASICIPKKDDSKRRLGGVISAGKNFETIS
jgi:hypothetical protein